MTDSVSTLAYITQDTGESYGLNVLVDGMHCPSCVAIIENALKKQSGIISARLNLTTRRLKITWNGQKSLGDKWVELINSMGYKAVPFDIESSESQEKSNERELLRCLAAAGFASGNLMLFSVPLWSSDATEMGNVTRTMFQWIQALIAIPAIIYCGRPFYTSAWRALSEWRTNMDVPISVAVILATIMSMFETLTHGMHAYFDSAVMLLFFLLIGRYLDAQARGKARSAAHDLMKMMTGFATLIRDNGSLETIALSEIREGMTLQVAAGEKIGADGIIIQGHSDLDTSLLTGETMPRRVATGDKVYAGTLNLSEPICVKVLKAGEFSMLAEIIRLMETAEQSQARYVTIADKIAAWYTPVVHILAAVTFLGWWYAGAAWQVALLYAATVLIITCPCALGLAVPVVQVLASSKLMRQGVLLKSGSALERLSTITHIAFDKTGTLTVGKPSLIDSHSCSHETLQLAASIASKSKHPLSMAICRAYSGNILPLSVSEVKGSGLETLYNGKRVRLGKRDWCAVKSSVSDHLMELWLAVEGASPVRFTFDDQIRQDASAVIAALQHAGIKTLMLSGDRQEAVDNVANALNICDARALLLPSQKCSALNDLRESGASVLMVGDGLNDAPSLATANVSMSPASAMDITQNASDIVFQGEQLEPVLCAWQTAKFAQVLVKENFALSLLYNVIAIPIAVAGYVTPLIAAIAMSSSSLIVIANAMRLNRTNGRTS